MVVCHCLRINDRTISQLASHEAVTVDDVTRHCGAGGHCGGCRQTIRSVLDRAALSPRSPSDARAIGSPA